MKFRKSIFLLVLAWQCSLFSDEVVQRLADSDVQSAVIAPEPSESINEPRPILEAKLGYFFFADSTMRKVYDKGGIDAQISASYPVWRWLQIYGSVEYLTRWGRSLGSREKTTIWEVPLSLGLKPTWNIHAKIQYYFTIGPRYVFAHVHNHSEFVDKNLSQNGFAGFVNTGFNFFPIEHCSIDIFAEYFYSKLHFHPSDENVIGRDIQVGGFTFGGGAGYVF